MIKDIIIMMSIESSKLDNVYVYVDAGIIKKYSDPYVYGDELSSIMKNAAYNVLREEEIKGKILVVKILEGGRYYYISDALERLGIREYDEAEIDIKSRFKYDPNDVVTKVVEYGDVLEKIDENEIVLMGETIASGSTMKTFIDVVGEKLAKIRKVIFLGFHTYVGIERTIKKLEEYGVNYKFYSYGGLLGLGPNRTDMTIGYEPNFVPDRIRVFAYRKLGRYTADHLCVIGDFTYSFKYIDKYLAERVIQLRELFDSSPNKEREKLLFLIREGIVRMMQLGLDVKAIEDRLTEEFRRRRLLVGEVVDKKLSIEDIIKNEMFNR